MAELTAEQRNALPDSDFALVRMVDGKKQRDYPIDTRDRAVAALGRATSNATPAEQKTILAAVCHRYSDLPACQPATNQLASVLHHSMTQKRDSQGNFAK